jgi:hypothetical protein
MQPPIQYLVVASWEDNNWRYLGCKAAKKVCLSFYRAILFQGAEDFGAGNERTMEEETDMRGSA